MTKINWDEAPKGAQRCYVYPNGEFRYMRESKNRVLQYMGICNHLHTWTDCGSPGTFHPWLFATPRPDTAEPVTQCGELFADGDKYERTLVGLCGTHVKTDVYRVLDAFNTGDPTLDHLIKKALCAGLRGHKDKLTDYRNIVESAQKALILLEQKNNGK